MAGPRQRRRAAAGSPGHGLRDAGPSASVAGSRRHPREGQGREGQGREGQDRHD